MSSLSEKYHAVAVDLYGYGKSPDWPSLKDVQLADEIALIEPILSQAGRFHLVGHSHGANISLKIALYYPENVASLTLYEPTAFYLLEPGESARLEIETIRDETKRLLEAGENEKATKGPKVLWKRRQILGIKLRILTSSTRPDDRVWGLERLGNQHQLSNHPRWALRNDHR
jgi:pimeloyl-ACP methyl ester carboxylesterase